MAARRGPTRVVVLACLAVAVSLFALSGGSASGAASARGPQAPGLKTGDKYVALGSSFASGPMIPGVADKSCLRSAGNYAHLVAAKLKLALTDVSCGAATTDNILSQPQGVHPPQIGSVTPDTKLVTVTIGGNDVNYTASNLACANAGAKGQSCVGSGVSRDDLNARLAALPAKMAATLGAIKHAAPKAKVLLVAYFRVLPPSATPCPPSVPMTSTDLQLMVGVGQQLESISKRAAAAAKVGFVDIYAPKGHDACAAPAQRWVEGQVPASPAFPFHPNAAGMAAAAKLIERQVRS